MKAALVLAIALAAGACSKKRIAECETFQGTIDKLARCKSLPEDARTEISKQAKTLREMFDALDQAGGVDKAPQNLQDQLRDACKTQNSAIVEMYAKVAPDCLK